MGRVSNHHQISKGGEGQCAVTAVRLLLSVSHEACSSKEDSLFSSKILKTYLDFAIWRDMFVVVVIVLLLFLFFTIEIQFFL